MGDIKRKCVHGWFKKYDLLNKNWNYTRWNTCDKLLMYWRWSLWKGRSWMARILNIYIYKKKKNNKATNKKKYYEAKSSLVWHITKCYNTIGQINDQESNGWNGLSLLQNTGDEILREKKHIYLKFIKLWLYLLFPNFK